MAGNTPIHIRPLDLVTVVVYLLAMAGMGIYFARRMKSTEEYFVGDRSFPGWAIGLSMLGTSISSVTFLAFPAAAFIGDWRQLVMNLTIPLVAVLAVVVFIPFFRRGNTTSAFEYLGDRFGPTTRLYGTISFIFLQLIRLGKVLFLVSIPVALLTGTSMRLVIVAVGIFIAFYTVIGGIEAVIWTDVIQSIVLWLGGAVCVAYVLLHMPEGPSQVFAIGSADGKFGLGPMEFDLARKTFWTVAFLGIFNWLAMYSSDQNVIQRYIAAKSTREARKATILYTVTALPTWAFFFFVGTCVYAYFHATPDAAVTGFCEAKQADQIFPYFILTRLPAGIAGIVIAGVLAAAMSSLDSSINAIATVCTVDLLKPFLAKGRDDRFYLRCARWIATVTAALMIVGACVFSVVEKESMNDLSLIMDSVFGGCLVGLFLLGFFTTRVDSLAATTALAVGILCNIYLGLNASGWLPESLCLPVHSYWVGILVNTVFVLVALAISLCRRQQRDLTGLTVWTMPKEEKQA